MEHTPLPRRIGGLVALHLYVRRLVSVPRIGTAKMRSGGEKRILLTIAVVLLMATLSLVFVTLRFPQVLPHPILAGLPAWISELWVDILVMLALVGLFSLMAYLFGIQRLYLYGWLLGLGNLASTILYLNAGFVFNLPLAIAAAIVTLIGVVLLIRFLRTYSVPVEEA